MSWWFANFIGKMSDSLIMPTRPCQSGLCFPLQLLLLFRQHHDEWPRTNLFSLPLNPSSLRVSASLFPLFIPLLFLLCTGILSSYSSGNSLISFPVPFLVFQFSFKALITVTFTYISIFICLMPVFSTKLQALEWQGFFQSCLPLFLGLLAKGIEFRIGSINICWMSKWMMNEETLYSLWSLHSPCQL